MTDIEQGLEGRALLPSDLDAVVAIDHAVSGRQRRGYFERRLQAALSQPARHLQRAVLLRGRLVGYVLARRLEGEFGQIEPTLRLEVIGVASDVQGHGVGARLLADLERVGAAAGATAIRTQVSWRDHAMLSWLDHAGFSLGRVFVVGLSVHEREGDREEEMAEARDGVDVRTLAEADIDAIVRIDRKLMGVERRAYLEGLVAEATGRAGVRVSLTARVDGAVVGFVMARTDLGDFGRVDPVAVLDTLGVDPMFARHHVGTALLSQLIVNLRALCIERLETVVAPRHLDLLAFLCKARFEPSHRLPFEKRLG